MNYSLSMERKALDITPPVGVRIKGSTSDGYCCNYIFCVTSAQDEKVRCVRAGYCYYNFFLKMKKGLYFSWPIT